MQQDSGNAPAPAQAGGWGVDHLATFTPTDTLAGQPDGAAVILAGAISSWHGRVTRQHRAWADGILTLGSGEAVVFQLFPNAFPSSRHLLTRGGRVIVHARVDLRDDVPRVNIRAMNHPDDVTAAGTVLTPERLDRLAAEAEAGYDPAQFIPRRERNT